MTSTVDGADAVAILMAAHYHLMDNPRFWYDKGILEASRIMCEIASELRMQFAQKER